MNFLINIFLGFILLWFLGYFIYYMVTKNKSCSATGDSGDQCTDKCQCKSGACALTTGSTTPVCCPTGQTITDSSGILYCAGYPNASPCSNNQMCASGNCVNGKCSGGVTACNSTTCTTGCGYPDATRSSPITCCPNGNVGIAGNAYCKNSANGTPCLDGSQCASGSCAGGNSATGQIGLCQSKKVIPTNKTCGADSDCNTGACAYSDPTGQGNYTLYCCNGQDNWEVWWGHQYCTNLPPGYSCHTDAFCASGNCQNGVCQ